MTIHERMDTREWDLTLTLCTKWDYLVSTSILWHRVFRNLSTRPRQPAMKKFVFKKNPLALFLLSSSWLYYYESPIYWTWSVCYYKLSWSSDMIKSRQICACPRAHRDIDQVGAGVLTNLPRGYQIARRHNAGPWQKRPTGLSHVWATRKIIQ